MINKTLLSILFFCIISATLQKKCDKDHTSKSKKLLIKTNDDPIKKNKKPKLKKKLCFVGLLNSILSKLYKPKIKSKKSKGSK